MKVYVDSNNKAFAYGGKVLTKGDAPDATFTVYDNRVSIDSITQTALNDTTIQVDAVLTALMDLSSTQNTLLTTASASGYTIISGVGSYYLNDVTSTTYPITWGSSKVYFGGGAKSTGDKLHASFILIETNNS